MSDNYEEKVLKTLNVLFVSSDTETRDAVEKKFKDDFASFLSVLTAEEGLSIFNAGRVDLIISDYFLPGMNGMEFIREVKTLNHNMPVIMISNYMDTQFIMTSMNMGVTQFVAKPIQAGLLRNAINRVVERVVIYNLERKAREQELELLKYRERDRITNQELAFRKELNIIRNDFFMRYYDPYGEQDVDGSRGWNFEVVYKSKDGLCGDSYACRRLHDGSALIFLADAMGKGISASITSILAVSLVNYLVNDSIKEKSFDLRYIVSKYTDFIKDKLLEEEVMCSAFIHLDFEKEKMFYASFAMPRIALGYANGEVKKFMSNNLPIMNFVSGINIGEADIKDVTRVFAFSDGLIESETVEGIIYSPFLRRDFIGSPFLSMLEKKIMSRMKDFQDDATLIFLNRPFACKKYEEVFEISTRYDSLPEARDFIAVEMEKNGMDPKKYEIFFTAFAESIMNAYEHGNLNIDLYEKNLLMREDMYEGELLKREKGCDKKIFVRFIYCSSDNYSYIITGVRDEGKGYPLDSFRAQTDGLMKFCGRGMKVMSYYADAVFFSEDRREVFLAKTV